MSKRRVLRGGSYVSFDSWFLRSTSRVRFEPEFRSWDFGFRIVVVRVLSVDK